MAKGGEAEEPNADGELDRLADEAAAARACAGDGGALDHARTAPRVEGEASFDMVRVGDGLPGLVFAGTDLCSLRGLVFDGRVFFAGRQHNGG